MSPASTTISEVVAAVAHRRRRDVLRILGENERISDHALASAVAEIESERGKAHADAETVAIALYHTHLPKLADAGLIEYDETSGSIRRTEHPAWRGGLERVLGSPGDDEGREWDRLFRTLTAPRRWAVVSILAGRRAPVSVSDLATLLAAREAGVSPLDVPRAGRRPVAISLRHVHLPMLADVGLIEYDEASNAVAPSAPLRMDDRSPGLALDAGTEETRIVGRDAILARQRALLNRADDELFLVVASRDALGDDTLATLRAAVDRGASVYFGSPDATLRAIVRERVPGAVVWEPRGWSNEPDGGEASLVRLASSDRESALLATRQPGGGRAAETAIVADDGDDPLVVLVAELVDEWVARLDGSCTPLTG